MPEPTQHKSGYVAIVGKPNVGKSTLLNALVGRKLSIVTRKPQTTRSNVLGIATAPEYQIIFLDTPGVIEPRYGLHRSMMRSVDRALRDADVVVLMAEATREEPDSEMVDRLGTRPAILVLNKIDLIRQVDAVPLVEKYSALRDYEAIIPLSAKKVINVDTLLSEILARLPVGPPYYPEDVITEQPERFFVAEIIREKIFLQYQQEIPYSTQVNIVAYEEREKEKDMIDAEIIVERQTQKGILIGKKGLALKRVGQAAREDIEAFLGRPVYLKLFVKVRESWRDSDLMLRSFGYDDPQDR